MSLPILPSFVGGGPVQGGGAGFESINPATGLAWAVVHEVTQADVDRAVAAAQAGFTLWSAMTGTERGRILRRAADILRQRNDELAALEVQDCGKPIQEALVVDVVSGADCIEYFAGAAATLSGQQYPLKNAFAYSRREPLGVCVGIGAWNYPLQIACWKSAPALAAGNAMVFKPSELTPATAVKLAEIYLEAGVPPGVFNVLQGRGAVGAMLASHPDVAKVSVTGSVPTGKRVMETAAGTLKRVTMELGGKSPLLVFDDADLEQAVAAAMMGNFYTQGEVCTHCTRVFVQKGIAPRFLARLKERTALLRVGDPADPATEIGALISEAHADKVMDYIASGVAEGASLVCGGERVAVDGLGRNFVAPTIFADCRDDMRIVREEIFGPVLSMLTFDTEAEAVARANRSRFGLAAGVFTSDLQRGHRVAAQLRAGICWINNYNIAPIEMPFGGVGESGIGSENSMAALDHYTQLKTVYVELGEVATGYR
ncbi:betaine-aldehyde dehydrogenase [Hydrogenophaga pseudoflava]|uniref:betaine-aldehyde dehydrogenase n=1 Tax=Hydrogenophaga pseudoflava TaxID=47421 RepID=UPI0027E476C4|nr:betaine-aldehyde dehydrogenase [Hydrogenophaga pseudoflava]MDQ7746656.1 betaine-aldehyde dehydrogenase [Hydrogenophaga pseudoflava]